MTNEVGSWIPRTPRKCARQVPAGLPVRTRCGRVAVFKDENFDLKARRRKPGRPFEIQLQGLHRERALHARDGAQEPARRFGERLPDAGMPDKS